ncbi:MAG: type phosphodiesterase/nucleotide pyrophosphatase [Alphaproteobacteria bacterium]|nr:type phosphodiesterase/nucleotide pyrophosphatase [Alphaproteobacteria bacterium]
MRRVTFLGLALLCAPLAAHAAPVLMISIDGLRPGDVLEADKRGLKIPALRRLAAEGATASGVRNALPTVTYPNHTTLITGVWPARHGIPGNQTFDPLQQNFSGWYWYSRDIKVRTLWDAVHDSGGKVASLSWPVSVGAAAIDYNVPEYWRAHNADDIKLVRALSTPGLVDQLEKATGLALADADGETVEVDVGRTRFAAALIAAKHPQFTTVHLRGLDHIEHGFGPGSAEAKAALETLDAAVGTLVAAAREAEPGLVVAIVSDHGFAPVEHDVNLIGPFVQAGLITLDGAGKVKSWEAEPWGGASVPVTLAHPEDAVVKAKVSALLNGLAAKPELGIAGVADAAQIAQMGGSPMASFWVDFKPGYEMGQNPAAPPVGAGAVKGTHGYFPTHPEMRATFILSGPGIASKSLGEIDMRDIAPTLAKVLNVSLPQVDGKPLL